MPDERSLPQENDIPLGWEAVASFEPEQEGEAIAMRDEFRRNRHSACVTLNSGRFIVWAQKFTKWPPPTSFPNQPNTK